MLPVRVAVHNGSSYSANKLTKDNLMEFHIAYIAIQDILMVSHCDWENIIPRQVIFDFSGVDMIWENMEHARISLYSIPRIWCRY